MAIMQDPDNPPQPDESSPATSPLPGPPSQNRSDPDQRQKIIDGIIIPDFTKIAGRAPSQQEIDEYYDVYTRFGGTAFRGKVTERFPAPKSWFDQNAPGFGAPPDPFGEQYTAGTYTPGEFKEDFVAPTAESLSTDPGYLARSNELQRGMERGAAAKGSILSGGFVGRTLPRAQSEFASQEYGKAFGRAFLPF